MVGLTEKEKQLKLFTDDKTLVQYTPQLQKLNTLIVLTPELKQKLLALDSADSQNKPNLGAVMKVVEKLRELKVSDTTITSYFNNALENPVNRMAMYHLFEKNYINHDNFATFQKIKDPNFFKIIHTFTQNCPGSLNQEIVDKLMEKNDSRLFMAFIGMQNLYKVQESIPVEESMRLINLYASNIPGKDKSPIVVPYKGMLGQQEFKVYDSKGDERRANKQTILAAYQVKIENCTSIDEVDRTLNPDKKNKQSDYHVLIKQNNPLNPIVESAIMFNFMEERKKDSLKTPEGSPELRSK